MSLMTTCVLGIFARIPAFLSIISEIVEMCKYFPMDVEDPLQSLAWSRSSASSTQCRNRSPGPWYAPRRMLSYLLPLKPRFATQVKQTPRSPRSYIHNRGLSQCIQLPFQHVRSLSVRVVHAGDRGAAVRRRIGHGVPGGRWIIISRRELGSEICARFLHGALVLSMSGC
ncbi:hypothetical protein EJ02DRAFT_247226 [Clathrospora elynae]|uniref:Uncharacterized protein n=1 Tax=Clathrospora elynae TaxID=706981 RepID=A0A6A5T2F3_9PLEO|nr:hypothetical protein EJ02DRAFT_247226 [Clathrospora elynae]